MRTDPMQAVAHAVLLRTEFMIHTSPEKPDCGWRKLTKGERAAAQRRADKEKESAQK